MSTPVNMDNIQTVLREPNTLALQCLVVHVSGKGQKVPECARNEHCVCLTKNWTKLSK